MRIFRKLEEIKDIKNPVVTTGSFDGVHVGHTMIIERINRLAKSIDGESVLITFFPHPRKVLFPDTNGKDLKLINSQQEKIELLSRTGLDNLIILQFTLEFAKTTSDEFVKNILVDRIGVKKIVIGFNHHFGHNREGGYDKLYQQGIDWGFTVEEIPEQELHNETISSTKIRKALKEGNVQKANAYLDHHYVIAGELKISKHISDPISQWYSIDIQEDCKLIPTTGLYATSMHYKGTQYKGMVIVNDSTNPLKGCNHNKVVYATYFDLEEALHGRTITIQFAKRMSDIPDFAHQKKLLQLINSNRNRIQEMIY